MWIAREKLASSSFLCLCCVVSVCVSVVVLVMRVWFVCVRASGGVCVWFVCTRMTSLLRNTNTDRNLTWTKKERKRA